MLRVGIIGAGLIGQKRAAHLEGAQLVAIADRRRDQAEKLAALHQAVAEADGERLLRRSDVDLVIIATSNDALVPLATAALQAGKHVLLEKPAGRHPGEIETLIHHAQEVRKVIRVGFNHRFHPGLREAKKIVAQGTLGPLLYFRARYGHGGRVGYEREWRADPKISGGGELLDQGVHLIDLCRWIGGEFSLQWGKAKTFFWDMPVEDNGFLYLESPDQTRSAFLHASWTEWKNLFDFEIFCRTGKLEISGLGRSYGVEELRIYRMKPGMGPPEIHTESFPDQDNSWQLEFDAFLREIGGTHTEIATLTDALRAMEIVHEIYKESPRRGGP